MNDCRSVIMTSEEIITLMQSHEHLWNLKSKDYHNLILKNRSWNIIADAVGLQVDDVKKKWNGLRDTRRQIKNKQNKLFKSGNGTEGVRPITWPYYEMMTFLDDCAERKKTLSNLSNIETSEENSQQIDDVELSQPQGGSSAISKDLGESISKRVENQQNRKKKNCLNSLLVDQAILKYIENTPKATSKDDDEDELYGKLTNFLLNSTANTFFSLLAARSVSASLKKLNPILKAKAKVRIQQVLLEIEESQHAARSSLTEIGNIVGDAGSFCSNNVQTFHISEVYENLG